MGIKSKATRPYDKRRNPFGNIHFTLLSVIVEENKAVAEWTGDFIDTIINEQVHMYEVAFLEFTQGKISSLRETWHTQRTKIGSV